MINTKCINDKDKPSSIPNTHWVKEGKDYTVVMIYRMVQPGAMMGVILQEIDLNEVETPYECFKIQRFGFKQEDIKALMELIEACEGLQDFDPAKLIEEQVQIEEQLK